MTAFTVDASVAIKWFVPEIFQADAQRLQNSACELHVPTLFDVELGNILWKKIRKGELTRPESDDILAQVSILPLTRHSELPLLTSAFDLAVRAQRSVYDCLYLALAIQRSAPMVTADQKLYNVLSATPWAKNLCWIEDVP
jgi:predicted nucleic acid-binding protein